MKKLLFLFFIISCEKPDTFKLFNGNSLEGWEGSNKIFKVKNLKEEKELSLNEKELMEFFNG